MELFADLRHKIIADIAALVLKELRLVVIPLVIIAHRHHTVIPIVSGSQVADLGRDEALSLLF